MMLIKCIVIGNQGSFFTTACNSLSTQGFSVDAIEINKYDFDFELLVNSVLKLVSIKNCFSLIYLGGEVKIETFMQTFNFDIPKSLALICKIHSVRFVYLSSLAALGEHLTGPVLISDRNSINLDVYAKTKQNFDLFVSSDSVLRLLCCGVYPASIVGKSHENSSLQQVIRLFKNFKILRYLNIKTYISFCHRDDIVCAIIFCLRSPYCMNIIVAENATFSDISREVFKTERFIPLPSFVDLVYFLRPFFSLRYRIIIRRVFNEAIYVNNSDITLYFNFPSVRTRAIFSNLVVD